jgi:hypothetical protein
MMSFGSYRRLNRSLLAAALGMTVLVGCAGSFAQAAEDDDETVLPDQKFFRGIMKGLGLKRDESSIDYRERSPLVLPPGQDLPPPETDINAKKTANWPDDPDIKQARQRKEAERKRKNPEPGVDDRPLLPSQLSNGAPPVGSKAGEAAGRSAEQSAAPSSQAELGSKGFSSMFGSIWAPKEEYKPFTGEPPRVSLTEPPAGYRTPSPNQPFGVGREKWTPTVIDKNEPVK